MNRFSVQKTPQLVGQGSRVRVALRGCFFQALHTDRLEIARQARLQSCGRDRLVLLQHANRFHRSVTL